MSCLHMIWAHEQGRRLRLTTSERVVLQGLAERAHSDTGLCWPTQEVMMSDTGLSERTCRATTQLLAQRGLIRMELRGRAMNYWVLMPAGDDEQQSPSPGIDSHSPTQEDEHRQPLPPLGGSTPATIAGIPPSTPATIAGIPPSTPATIAAVPPKTPATIAGKPVKKEEPGKKAKGSPPKSPRRRGDFPPGRLSVTDQIRRDWNLGSFLHPDIRDDDGPLDRRLMA